MEKKKLYNEILSLVEEELFQRKNPQYYNDRINNIQDTIQTGGSPNILNDRPIYEIPGKFNIIRNSFNLSIGEAVAGSRQRQKLFSKLIKKYN